MNTMTLSDLQNEDDESMDLATDVFAQARRRFEFPLSIVMV